MNNAPVHQISSPQHLSHPSSQQQLQLASNTLLQQFQNSLKHHQPSTATVHNQDLIPSQQEHLLPLPLAIQNELRQNSALQVVLAKLLDNNFAIIFSSLLLQQLTPLSSSFFRITAESGIFCSSGGNIYHLATAMQDWQTATSKEVQQQVQQCWPSKMV